MPYKLSLTALARTLAWCVLGIACAPALADDGAPDTSRMSVQDIANLSADSAPVAAAITPARANVLREAALPLGSHKGLADRSAELIAALDARAARLDSMYRFGALITRNGVLPPVITEARDAIEASNDQVRRADAMYKIAIPARFASIAPSWRDYLYVGLRIKAQVDALPFSSMLPKTAAERAYWKQQVESGYQQGRALADQILETNLARLNRDYTGMLRYSELLNRGMVSEPEVAVAPRIVSGDRTHIDVGDTLYRVTDHGGFVTDPSKWQATVAAPVAGTAK